MNNKIIHFASALALLFASHEIAQADQITFQADMDYQINGIFVFDTNDDTVEVRGAWDGWANGVALVNNGANIYTNTINIIGYTPGTPMQYKFHYYGDYDNWESLQSYIYTNGGNRAFTLTGSAQTLTPAYFNDDWDGTTPIVFQVDMGPQIYANNFIPGSDTVEVRGSWDGFSNGISLTNNPIGANPNLYSMTFRCPYPAPGGLASYKFHLYGSHDIYEPDPNRQTLVVQPQTTLSPVYFSGLETNDLLPAATTVTFTVNMANAVDIFGVPFDPSNDDILIAGDFTYPVWNINWQDPLLLLDYSQYILQNNPAGSPYYTYTITLPAGNPVRAQYKYGICHNAGSLSNVNADNEADFELNHTRYIRTTGTYNFPVDIFGQQQTNLAAATEISFGNLQIQRMNPGRLGSRTNLVTWLGRPGIHLQTATNVAGAWVDHWETDGWAATNWVSANKAGYFRLVKP